MTRLRGFLCGLLISAPVTLYALPVTVTWDAVDCPTGAAILSATAYSEGRTLTTTAAVTFPAASAAVTFPDMPAGAWAVVPSVAHSNGAVYSGGVEYVTVAGPTPTPTPEPTPTPTPTPTRSPTPTCEKVAGGANEFGTFGIESGWLVRTTGGVKSYAFPSGAAQPGAGASELIFLGANRTLVIHDSRDGLWYEYIGAPIASSKLYNGTGAEPVCDSTTPTPTPAPPAQDLNVLTLKLDQIISILSTPPPEPVSYACTITAVQTPYANGDSRSTLRCPTAFNKDQAIKVIK